jgi:hypothetical protein
VAAQQLVVDVGSGLLALLGGGSIVLVAVCAYVSKIVADRSIEKHKATLSRELERLKGELAKETETHKLRLKKAEILFDRELEATSDFSVLYRRILPSYSRPDMEWEDACSIVAGRFASIENDLTAYMTRHGPVVTSALRDKVTHCITLAAHNKFAIHDVPEVDLANERRAAGELLDTMRDIEEGLFRMVREESLA